MSSLLLSRSITATLWSAIDACGRAGLQFLVGLILSRLLLPEQFGVVAMMSLFTAVASVFVDGGFGCALIQKQKLAPQDASSVFYFNIATGLLAMVALYVAAPCIAAFYRRPELVGLTKLMGLNIFIGTFGMVQNALLSRDLDFRTQVRIGGAAAVISGCVAVILAWLGCGVWSLAVQALLSTFISSLLLWYLRPWRPSFCLNFSALRSLLRFGSYLFLSGIIEAVYTRLYTLIIGRFYSPVDLGLYTRADSTQQLPSTLFTSVVNRVALPVFSSVAKDNVLLRRGMRKALSMLMLVNLPVMLGLAGVSRLLVLILFGQKWLLCVPYLQVLCLVGAMLPLHVINLSVINAMGRSDLFLRVEIVKKTVGFVILLITSQTSVLAMAWGQVISGIICFFLNAFYVGVLIDYTALNQLRDILPCCLAAFLMFCCVIPLSFLPVKSPVLLLAIQVFFGAATYWVCCIGFKISGYGDLLKEIKRRLASAQQFATV